VVYKQGENMPTLNAPTQVVFIISLILAVIAVIGWFAGIPYLGNHPVIS
jgi:energy-converting hydrogenase Eha subunit F